MYYKYPRTLHLPFSLGSTSDDKFMENVDQFKGMETVVTEKMDGENTNLYSDRYHARSIDSKDHESRHWVKGLWGQVKHMIPEGWRICGENVYAKHSISYDNLGTYFYVFGVYDENNICLSWRDTVEFSKELGLDTVTQIPMASNLFNEDHLRYLADNWDIEKKEGFVVRNAKSFHFDDHQLNTGKWVRPKHVQSSSHWMTEKVIPNQLKIGRIDYEQR